MWKSIHRIFVALLAAWLGVVACTAMSWGHAFLALLAGLLALLCWPFVRMVAGFIFRARL